MSELTESVRKMLDAAADRNAVERAIVRGVAWVESQGDQSLVSRKGARGIMQLMPATAQALGVDIDDPAENIEGGSRYLAQLFRRFGTWSDALAAYVWGEGNVGKKLPRPGDVDAYVEAVTERARAEREKAAPYIRERTTLPVTVQRGRTYWAVIDVGLASVAVDHETLFNEFRKIVKVTHLDVTEDVGDTRADRPYTYEPKRGRFWLAFVPETTQTIADLPAVATLTQLFSRAGIPTGEAKPRTPARTPARSSSSSSTLEPASVGAALCMAVSALGLLLFAFKSRRTTA